MRSMLMAILTGATVVVGCGEPPPRPENCDYGRVFCVCDFTKDGLGCWWTWRGCGEPSETS